MFTLRQSTSCHNPGAPVWCAAPFRAAGWDDAPLCLKPSWVRCAAHRARQHRAQYALFGVLDGPWHTMTQPANVPCLGLRSQLAKKSKPKTKRTPGSPHSKQKTPISLEHQSDSICPGNTSKPLAPFRETTAPTTPNAPRNTQTWLHVRRLQHRMTLKLFRENRPSATHPRGNPSLVLFPTYFESSRNSHCHCEAFLNGAFSIILLSTQQPSQKATPPPPSESFQEGEV
jgi:hypothetical protein